MSPEARSLWQSINSLLGSLAALFFFVQALIRFVGGHEELGLKWLAVAVLAEIANALQELAHKAGTDA